MPCTVKKTFEAAARANCHLVVQLKNNQPALVRRVKAVIATDTPMSRHETTDRKRRMRSETRCTEVFNAVPALANTPWDGHIMCIIRVTRTTLIRRAKDGLWDTRQETGLYVSSLPLDAEKAGTIIRSHWKVENQNHYVRDVSMLEDASRIRSNPGIFARLRSFALNILRANNEKNIADALWKNTLNFKRIMAYKYI